MRLRPEVLLAVVGLAFSQGCGSCVGEASPTEKQSSAAPAPKPITDPRLIKTRVKDIAITLDATPAESVMPDGSTPTPTP